MNQQNNLLPPSDQDYCTEPISVPRVSAKLNISHVTKQRVAELLLAIPFQKATGDDGVGAKLLRIAAPAITDSLSRLINLCIDTNVSSEVESRQGDAHFQRERKSR